MCEKMVALVPGGEDRFGERRTTGVNSTDFKVSAQDSNGGLFVMEVTNRKKGGPSRHLHHNEDEWFYLIEGEYIVEVGEKFFRLRPGDSILAHREVPHAWAFVGDAQGKLLIAFAPANRIEELFSNRPIRNDTEVLRAHGAEIVGPPLSVE
ncbi:MAG TPA: cupin domain-containing protein [bacterium]|nr:cupin domain-containing protein [bacterium]